MRVLAKFRKNLIISARRLGAVQKRKCQSKPNQIYLLIAGVEAVADEPVATAPGSAFVDPQCQTCYYDRVLNVTTMRIVEHSMHFSGCDESEARPTTNTEPGAVATGSEVR